MKEIKSKLAILNRFDGFTFKVRDEGDAYSLIKSFHQMGRTARYRRSYDEVLVKSVNLETLGFVVEALMKDHEPALV